MAEFHINYPGPDSDGTEGNGIPDLGEPNFEITDNDESDQIGLTSFYSAPYPAVYPSNDEVMWAQLSPGIFQVPQQEVDQTFLYGSGYISLAPGEKKKFAIAMVYGEDMSDILRNTVTMQNIYDNDYSFAKPPLKPTMSAVAGNNKVTLYWNDFSEKSVDPIYGYDFEGYRLYRSTDPGFIDAYTITDAFGNITFKKPIAVFDITNGLEGPHPIGYNGVQFDMGSDSGIRYTFTDSIGVINGQKYYYAITAFDKGYDLDFFENGFSENENLIPIAPSECSITLDLDYKGNVVNLSENAAIVVPNSEAIGYIPANYTSDDGDFVRHIAGYGTGNITVEVIDPLAVKDENKYQIIFDNISSTSQIGFSVKDMTVITEMLKINSDSTAVASKSKIDSNDSLIVASIDGDQLYDFGEDYSIIDGTGTFIVHNPDLIDRGEFLVSYRFFHLSDLRTINGEDDNPIFDGMRLKVTNTEYDLVEDSTGWTVGDCNYGLMALNVSRFYPSDFELQFEGEIGDSIHIDENGNSVPFLVKNITQMDDPPFRISDFDGDREWDPNESITIRPYDNISDGPLIIIRFSQDSIVISDTTVYDTVIAYGDTSINQVTYYDTIIVDIVHPSIGDIFHIEISRPFSADDIFGFTTTSSKIDNDIARTQLDKIAVVPNPYIVAASWEPRHQYQSGRGPRKIDFINLPNKCTIKIFTISGYLVTSILHDSINENGTESWNLLSDDNLEISYGIYLYHVDAPDIGEYTGKFAVIK